MCVAGIEVVDVAHAIQLAVAPVFLLSGVGVVLGVLTARLARIVDRARAAEDRVRNDTAHDTPETRSQLRVLARRARLINIAITLITVTALLVALVIALLFASTFAPMNLATPVAVLFVLSMISLVVALIAFLLEVRIAIAVLRIGSW
jgi:CBS domain containing-hemolysin-like protein